MNGAEYAVTAPKFLWFKFRPVHLRDRVQNEFILF